MSPAESPTDRFDAPDQRRFTLWPKRWLWRLCLLALIALSVAGATVWNDREQIAEGFIDEALSANGLQARYDIVSIGTQRHEIANLVIGDPSSPDLTAERVVVDLSLGLGGPGIGRAELVRPRLHGSYRDGRLSLGSLDSLLYSESTGDPGLPAIDLAVIDGRARIESEFGAIGAKLEGEGRLDGGFEGILAATAPQIGIEGCRAEQATAYGTVSVADGKPGFDGPLRLRAVDCAGSRIADADIAAKLELTDDLGSLEGEFGIAGSAIATDDLALGDVRASADLMWRFAGSGDQGDGELSLRHEASANDLATPYALIGEISADGVLRASGDLSRLEWSTTIDGAAIALDPASRRAIADLRDASEGSLLAALLTKLDRGLSRALDDGSLQAEAIIRSDDQGLRASVPEARVRSSDGESVLALSRVSYGSAGDGREPQLSGNFAAGGSDLPRINGRMEQTSGGGLVLRLAMAPYRAGEDVMAIPRMELRQLAGQGVVFDGVVEASGALPGGSATGLSLPVDGVWSARSGLAVGRKCIELTAERLELGELSIDGQAIELCPKDQSAMLRYDEALEISATSDNLIIAAAMGGTPTTIAAKRADIRYPQPFEVHGLSAVLGEADSAVRLSASQLSGGFSDSIGGRFTGGLAAMDVVPMDLTEMSGNWSFSDGVLRVDGGTFLLNDRIDPQVSTEPRFEPLYATGADLVLDDGIIRAEAGLRHPRSGTLVSDVTIQHALSSGEGRADISVPGIEFSDAIQPDDLSILAQGVIAAAEGLVTGSGEVRWNSEGVQSSGSFRSDGVDFAAEFGPVHGLRGEIVFTDLIGLTTAPSQVIEVASINTGIEALAGRIVYSITGGEVIRIEDGRWPFMGGTLTLRPTTIAYRAAGGQSYVFEIVGLDAAAFVSQMELDNLGATGTFDGTIPIHFDEDGNGSILGGLLISRQPGGNVSYVGELTYEDLGTMANYAFESLRSLDYRQMAVELNGSLGGEIITNFQIDGVRQGEGASRNFVTRRLSRLPIRFKINVRSENFYQLATIVRGMFDPAAFGTPEQRGIQLFSEGQLVPLAPSDPSAPNTANPLDLQLRDESTVQPPESDELP